MGRLTAWTVLALVLLAFAAGVQDVRADVPSENECRPYIEKALHELKGDVVEDGIASDEDKPTSNETEETNDASREADNQSGEEAGEDNQSAEVDADVSDAPSSENNDTDADQSEEEVTDTTDEEESSSREKRSAENEEPDQVAGDNSKQIDSGEDAENDSKTDNDVDNHSDADSGEENNADSVEAVVEVSEEAADAADSSEKPEASAEQVAEAEAVAVSVEEVESNGNSVEDTAEVNSEEVVENQSVEQDTAEAVSAEQDSSKSEDINDAQAEGVDSSVEENKSEEEKSTEVENSAEHNAASNEVIDATTSDEAKDAAASDETDNAAAAGETDSVTTSSESNEGVQSRETRDVSGEDTAEGEDPAKSNEDVAEESNEDATIAEGDEESKEEGSEVTKPVESFPEDDLLIEYTVPTNLRDHSHVTEILRLDEEFDEKEAAINKVADFVLKDLKKIYENAIKPLENLYKYRDLSNRHFGDPEIFSKPLVLFMGPWSGGKSTILNYLTDNEHTADSLRTGAEPSPAYFNILMHGDKPEVLDGTQLAADWTFSGLQKFGQGLEERLRGQKLPHKLLEKVNIVEIPGILEVRKQVSRLFPFNDACQWFIDRADIIFLVYDPSKLDVGPETEAILDQLKGREYQTRILLNKADQVKPEELLRVQGALIWNISPLMSSAQPPVMYTTSLWSHPYEDGAPVRLLQAQERSLLRDLRLAIDKRIDNKIASARRFAVRVRNHAKMVDCYLTTYYNHKTLFGNKNQIATNIIENPQNYHIYEGLSTLTNISRYDLPDPEVYRDFFRLNKLYSFQKLSETCTYFRGCPINKLDVAIAYDLPELVGKYKKAAEAALVSIEKKADGGKS